MYHRDHPRPLENWPFLGCRGGTFDHIGRSGGIWTVFRKKWIIRSCSRRAEEANRAEQWGDEMRLIV